jgi:hypothetical protein
MVLGLKINDLTNFLMVIFWLFARFLSALYSDSVINISAFLLLYFSGGSYGFGILFCFIVKNNF